VRLILASASPRRAELLTAAGIPFDLDPAAVDESPIDGEAASAYVERIARSKLHAGMSRHPAASVLAADTTVVIDDIILGKPADDREAASMLARLSGRTHEVLTAVALAPGDGRVLSEVETTRVTFVALTPPEIDWYVRSGEPRGKAGAYAIQGLASRFVERIDGSYSNVAGLPIATVWRLLKQTAMRPGP
jgi:nucleoside triphosphate pyrophosphatase